MLIIAITSAQTLYITRRIYYLQFGSQKSNRGLWATIKASARLRCFWRLVGAWGMWGLIKEKGRPTRGTSTRQAAWDGLRQGCVKGKHGTVQRLTANSYQPAGKRASERGLTCLGDMVQQHAGTVTVFQRAGAAAAWGSYNHNALSYDWLANAGQSVIRYAKQAGSRRRKICFLGPF